MNSEKYTLNVEAGVRYWEDAYVNEIQDEDGTLIPFRKGDLWRPSIELGTGRIKDWPVGTVAKIHYKVCDAGEYWLSDSTGQKVKKWKGDYVPDSLLCVGDQGYGDYIILNVDKDGKIEGWKTPHLEMSEWRDIK